MKLAIRVEYLEFQPFTERLRIRGVVVEGPEEYGVKGKYHTLNVEPGDKIVIWKEKWPMYQVDRLERASGVRENIIVATLDYDDACIALLSEQGIKVLEEISSRLPGKDDPSGFTKALNRYFEEVVRAIIENVEKYGVKAVVIASPGDLSKRIVDTLGDRLRNTIVVRDTVSMGGRSGLNEVLRRDSVKQVVKELSIVRGRAVLEEFKRLLVKDPLMIAYGIDDVEHAVNCNAVSKLLVSSDYLRTYDEEIRRRVNDLIEEAYRRRADVMIVPSDTDLGREINGLGGIIAILRFPLQRPSDVSINSS